MVEPTPTPAPTPTPTVPREPVQLVQRPAIPAQMPKPTRPSEIPDATRAQAEAKMVDAIQGPFPEEAAALRSKIEQSEQPPKPNTTPKLERPKPIELSEKGAEWARRAAAGEVDPKNIPAKYRTESVST